MPIKGYKCPHIFKLMRRLPSEQLPLPFRESFRLVFNPRVLPELTFMHWQYLRQMAFEDLDFTLHQALPQLLANLKTQERYDVPLLGLKLLDFMLNPLFDFKAYYLRLWPTAKAELPAYLEALQAYAAGVLRDLLRGPVLRSDFLVDLATFHKSDDAELCNDTLSVVWAT